MKPTLITLALVALTGCRTALQSSSAVLPEQAPRAFSYREVDGHTLNAYVFFPDAAAARERMPAILLFHGGGWVAGSAEWTFPAARRFAALGMVAISIDYRLSGGTVTPIEALADTCAAFRWVRQRASELKIDPKRVVGNGVSAGGQLVAAAATVGCPTDPASSGSARPDALLLWSPALDTAGDGWFRKLLQGRASASDYSPAEHMGSSTPPTSIVHGEKDTLTPLSGVKQFCDGVTQAGAICELNVYPGVGHLLTRNLANQEDDFDPDPKARADGNARQEHFLRERGFLSAR